MRSVRNMASETKQIGNPGNIYRNIVYATIPVKLKLGFNLSVKRYGINLMYNEDW